MESIHIMGTMKLNKKIIFNLSTELSFFSGEFKQKFWFDVAEGHNHLRKRLNLSIS